MAGQLMRLKSSTGLMSFVSTVWNGIPIMVTWNTLASEIMEIWNDDVVAHEDRDYLSDLVNDFLKGEMEI